MSHQTAQTENQPRRPLEGIRVVDAGLMVAGPFAASLLADFGADVIKVEMPGRGDPLRALGHKKDGADLWWLACNRNKQMIGLDLKDPEDMGMFCDLVAGADVLVENFAPGTLERLGLDYTTLATDNPGLVMLRVSGFGQTGPYSSWPGFARTSEAFSGLTNLTGYPDRPPVAISAFPLADYIAATLGAFAIMVALHERDQASGNGQEIDLALYEGIFRMMENACVSYDQLGVVGTRVGGEHNQAFPVGVWRSADGIEVSLAVGTDAMARRLFTAIGRPELADDERFAQVAGRVRNRPALDVILREWFAHRTGDEAIRTLGSAGVAVSPMHTMQSIFTDAHYAARQNLVTVSDDVLGDVRLPGVVPRLSRTPGAVTRTGGAINADRGEILTRWRHSSNQPDPDGV